jgi:hypothetical protein
MTAGMRHRLVWAFDGAVVAGMAAFALWVVGLVLLGAWADTAGVLLEPWPLIGVGVSMLLGAVAAFVVAARWYPTSPVEKSP